MLLYSLCRASRSGHPEQLLAPSKNGLSLLPSSLSPPIRERGSNWALWRALARFFQKNLLHAAELEEESSKKEEEKGASLRLAANDEEEVQPLSLTLSLFFSFLRSLPRSNNNNSRRNLSYVALALVALTAFAGSVFAAEATADSTAASGSTPPADTSASAKVAATAAVMEAEGRELDRADAGLDASKAAAAVDPDNLLSHAEMDAMMRDAGFSLNRDTGLYDPPAGADKSQLSRQVLLPDSGADHAAFANMLLDQQHKFIQVEHGEFSLPAGEF